MKTPCAEPRVHSACTIAVMGRTENLVKLLGPSAIEVVDAELLQIPLASFDIYVTNKMIAGRTLQDIADHVDEARGVLLRGIIRAEQSLPIGTGTIVERGDTLQVRGPENGVAK